MLIGDEDSALCAKISKPVFMHLSRESALVWLNQAPIFPSGTESVRLKRMWLQSYCLAATTTETRGQGKDSKQLDESRMSCNFALKVLELMQRTVCSPVCFRHRFDDSYNMWWLPHAFLFLLGIPSGCITIKHLQGPTCASHLWPMSPTPNKDHHRPEHELSLSLLSPPQHNCT